MFAFYYFNTPSFIHSPTYASFCLSLVVNMIEKRFSIYRSHPFSSSCISLNACRMGAFPATHLSCCCCWNCLYFDWDDRLALIINHAGGATSGVGGAAAPARASSSDCTIGMCWFRGCSERGWMFKQERNLSIYSNQASCAPRIHSIVL